MIYFLALSHAPPVFDDEIAICTPDTRPPASKPAKAPVPMMKPTTSGEPITYLDEDIINIYYKIRIEYNLTINIYI